LPRAAWFRQALRMRHLAILKTGSTFTDLAQRRGDFEDWFAHQLRFLGAKFSVLDAQALPLLPPAESFDGILVTGSSSTVHEHEPWSVRAGKWLHRAAHAGAPILGVCYGHQLLASSFGGLTGRNPSGREIGVIEVEVTTADPLFAHLPPRFPAFATHSDAVFSLPSCATVLATNLHTHVQAIALPKRVRTVQFHPEFDAEVMRHYLMTRAPQIESELGPGTTARLLAELRELPTGAQILRNFASWL
jgi:GMP synthase (glutamine-hydrolysing)